MTSVIMDIIARDHFSAQFIKAGAEAEGLAKKVQTTGSKIGSALKVGAAVGVAAVVALAGASVELASKYEDAQKRLETALKAAGSSFDTLKAPIAAANKQMEKLGFTNIDTADALTNLTVATKNPTKSLAELGLAADLARFKHISLAEAATVLGKAMAGNLKPIKALGIDLPVAAGGAVKVQAAMLAVSKAQTAYNTALADYKSRGSTANALIVIAQDKLTASQGRLNELQKSGKATAAQLATAQAAVLTAQLGLTKAENAGGASKDKVAAAAARLRAAQEKLNTVQGTGNTILKILAERLQGQAQTAASTLAGKVEVLRTRFEDMSIKVGTALIPVLIKLVGWVSTVTDFFQKHATLAKTLAAILGGVLVVAIGHVVVAWLAANLAFVATPIGAIILALVALAAAVVLLAKNWTTVWNAIKTFTVGVWNAITGFISDHWKLIVVLLTGGLGALAVFIITHWTQIKNTVAAVWDFLVNFIRGHWQTIAAILTGGISAVLIFVISHFNQIRDTIVGAFNAAIGAARAFPGMIARAVGSGLTVLVGFGADIVRGLWNGISSLGSWIWDKVKSIIPGWIKDALGIHSMPKWAIEAGQWILKGIAHGIMNLPGFLAKLTKNALGKIAALAASVGKGFVPGSPLGGAAGGGPSGSLASWITSAEMITGTPLAWGAAIQRRIMFESGGNPNAQNNWDVNAQAGDPSRGLMQTIGATFRAYHQAGTADNIFDPVANIAAAINYIKANYGTIFAIDPPVQGYESGAWNIARNQLAYLHRGEMVVPAGPAGAVRGGDGGGLVDAIRAGLSGLEFRFDGDGLARLVSAHQGFFGGKGVRR